MVFETSASKPRFNGRGVAVSAIAGALAAVALSIAGCGEVASAPLEAIPATSAQVEKIQAGVESPFRIEAAYTARSLAHKNSWFVAARIVGPGLEDRVRVGVWAHLRDPNDPGLVMSVSSYAKDFSDWPDGSRTQAQVSMNDPPAVALKRHVELQGK